MDQDIGESKVGDCVLVHSGVEVQLVVPECLPESMLVTPSKRNPSSMYSCIQNLQLLSRK